MVKRPFDGLLASILLLVVAPLLAVAAVGIRLASPGSIYNYTHGEAMLTPDDPERHYVERLLPLKLALDLVYVRRASWRYDVRLVGRTLWAVAGTVLGRRRFPEPPEMPAAQELLEHHSTAP